MCSSIIALAFPLGQLSHGDSHQSGGLCAQPAVAKCDGLITLADGIPHFID